MAEELSIIGKRLPRNDAVAKAKGEVKFISDIRLPRMLEAMLEGIHAAAERAGQGERLRRALGLSALAKRATGLNVGRLLFRRLHRRLFGGLQLRFCVSGGARISPRTLREFFLLGIPVVQGWGMTELSPVAAVQPFSALRFYLTRHYERKAGSIGPPLEGTAIRLFRSAGEASDFEEKDRGEMVVSGPHVMRGYHNDPDLTRRLMTPQGLRTGDIARRDRDGNLYIIGRAKHVIVLPNGKKVFPEQDLEEELSRCALVEEFTVRAAAGEDGTVRPLAGWVDLFILPGYRFRVTDAMLTNFHLPRSTLLMLVSAFAGRDHILRAYREAAAMKYRFYSFGDAMLIV